MTVLEQLVRRTASRSIQNGAVVLVANSDPLLIAAFAELGWSDPYLDPLPKAESTRGLTKATVESPERAVQPSPKGRLSGV